VTKKPIITGKRILLVGAVLVSAFAVVKSCIKTQQASVELLREQGKAKAEEKPALDIVLGRLSPHPGLDRKEGENVWYLDGQFTIFNPTPWPVEEATIAVWKHLGTDDPDAWIGAWRKWTPPCWKDVLKGHGLSFAHSVMVTTLPCHPDESPRLFKPDGKFVHWTTPQLTANPKITYCKEKRVYTMIVRLTWKKGKPLDKYIHIHCTPSARKPPAGGEFIWKLADGLPKGVSLPNPLRP